MTAASSPQQPYTLLKILGVTFGIAVALGSQIGAGILWSPSVIAGWVPSATLMLFLWVLGAVQAALGANVYAEMATALPRSGGAYNYAQRAFGDVGGLVVGWTYCLGELAGAAATSVAFAEFLPALWPAAGDHKIAIAVALQLALYGANMVGLREGAALQIATSSIKALMLLAFIFAAMLLAPEEPPQAAAMVAQGAGWANLVLAYRLIVGAYAGWWAPTTFSGENADPGRSIPRALAGGLGLTIILYLGVNLALVHALGTEGMAATPLPFPVVLGRLGGTLPALVFSLTALVTVASCANAGVMQGPRILLALAKDGLLPNVFGRVNRGGSPVAGYLLSAAVTLTLATTGTFALVFGLIGTLDAVCFTLVALAYFRLRQREPDLPRPYRAIGHPVLPALFLASAVVLLALVIPSDPAGCAVALGMGLLCVPLALLARRGRSMDGLKA